MGPDIESAVQARLDTIERTEDVRILYACESGSRAWGFASQDSDYDVRFIYIHRPEWYLSIEQADRRDVVELAIEDTLDISGWDLRKTLGLLRRSNPPLLEWLGSPHVYRDQGAFTSSLRSLATRFHSPRACAHHYLHMAQGNFREYLRGPEVWRKKYLYVLRPLLAIRWIRRGLGLVPTEFGVLIERVVDDPALVASIHELLREKKVGFETDRGPRIEPISAFIEAELTAAEAFDPPTPSEPPPVAEFDRLFRETLSVIWAPGGE